MLLTKVSTMRIFYQTYTNYLDIGRICAILQLEGAGYGKSEM